MNNDGWINAENFFIYPSEYIIELFEQGHVSFHFNKIASLTKLNGFHDTRCLKYVNEHSVGNVTQIPFK